MGEGSRRLRVLVVDDDAGQRMVVKIMLVREGYEVAPILTRTHAFYTP